MRKLLFPILAVLMLIANHADYTCVYASISSETFSKVYVPLQYISYVQNDITPEWVDLSAINVDRGVFSYVLFHLLNEGEQLPPTVTQDLKHKYNYDKLNDKRFEPIMKDYTVWAMESGYLSQVGRANHRLSVKWDDIERLFKLLQIKSVVINDYSIYDSDNWGFVTETEKNTIGLFYAAFGRGIDTKSIEKKKFICTVADMVHLVTAILDIEDVEVDDRTLFNLTGHGYFSAFEGQLKNSKILPVCFPYAQNQEDVIINDFKKWAKKEGFINYEG